MKFFKKGLVVALTLATCSLEVPFVSVNAAKTEKTDVSELARIGSEDSMEKASQENESSSKKDSEKKTEKISETDTETSVAVSSDARTEASTEVTTEVSTEATTAASTESSTEATTEERTEEQSKARVKRSAPTENQSQFDIPNVPNLALAPASRASMTSDQQKVVDWAKNR